jgi:hypothetical protein
MLESASAVVVIFLSLSKRSLMTCFSKKFSVSDWNCFLGIFILLGSFVLADDKVQDSILIPEKHDLGYVESKSIHLFTLEITNHTEQDCPIMDVDIQCGCIAVLEFPKNVPAKKSRLLQLEFTAPDTPGPYTKTISVKLGERIWKSRMSARIDYPLKIDPKNLIFSISEKVSEQSITVYNEGHVPVRLLYATAVPANCTVKIGAEPIEPGAKVILPVKLHDAQPNRQIALDIRTNHPAQKMITVLVKTK